MQADRALQQERIRAQRDRHRQILLDKSRRAREQEAAMRREENTENAAFNQAVLAVLGQLVQAVGRRNS
ncbi:hypothetical protein JOB18_025075 [Solea senegalensis]|uniref:Uncharacterized protein n=1 Tax=Solea senegalensis TaxID=28829 RepID=A0AAV6QLB9_SOLSE|nr:hypothetical protein JOB18_025075 [Solea senegalensis]